MPNYEFNEHGVCINPMVPFRLEHKKCFLEIRIAQRDGKWGYGLSLNLRFGNQSGSGFGVHNTRCTYPDERAVLVAATDDIAKSIQEEKVRQEPHLLSEFSCFAEFWKYHESLRQLSIF